MKISELMTAFETALAEAFPDAAVETAKTVQSALSRCAAYSSQRPLIVLAAGGRVPAETLGSVAAYGGVGRQSVQVWVAASGGIAKRAEAALDLADLAEEVEDACLAAAGAADFTDPRWDGSEPAQLPDGFPLDAWVVRVSVIKG